MDFAVEWYEYDFEYGQAVEVTGTAGSSVPTYDLWRDEDYFTTNQGLGYVAVVHEVGKPFLASGVVRFDSRVTNIEYGGGVIVTVQQLDNSTKTYGGKYAISTFSTGVLQHALEAELISSKDSLNESVEESGLLTDSYSYDEGFHRTDLPTPLTFSPPLPGWKKKVIATSPMGHYTKIFLKFDQQVR